MIRLEATEAGPPQILVWFAGLVTLNGFLIDVIEEGNAELAVPGVESEAVAVIPGRLLAF